LETSGGEDARAARAMALNVRGFSSAVLDADFAGADRQCEMAMQLVEGRFAAVGAALRLNPTLFAGGAGGFARASQLRRRATTAGKSLRLAHLVVWPYWFIGKARCCLGDYGGAIAQLEEGYQICDRIGDRAWKSRLLNTLGWCLAEIGCHDRAREANLHAARL